MFVKPKPGALVRDPASRMPLPADGREVPASSFWLRRLAAGDVIEVAPAAEKPAVEPKATTKSKDKAGEK